MQTFIGIMPFTLINFEYSFDLMLEKNVFLFCGGDKKEVREIINLIPNTFYTQEFISNLKQEDSAYLTVLTEIMDFEADKEDEHQANFTQSVHSTYYNLSMCLWLIKDCSISNQELLGFFKSQEDTSKKSIRQNIKDVKHSDSKGVYSVVKFSKEEIQKSLKYWDKLDLELLKQKEKKNNSTEYLGKTHVPSNNISFSEFSRIGKALLFVIEARKTTFLPSKIASYSSGFEALISTSKEQITVNIAERIANLLGNSLEEKKEIFKKVKDIYSARSNYIHGTDYSERKNKKLESLSQEADNLLRKLIVLFLENDKFYSLRWKNDTELDQWYRENYIFN
ncbi:hypothetical protein ACN9KL_05080 [Vagococcus fluvialis]|uniref:hypothetical protein n=1 Tax=Vagococcus fluvialis TaxID=2738 RepID=UPI003B216246